MSQRKKFDKAFKEQTVARILAGEITTSLMAKELGVHYSTVRDWVKKYEKDGLNASYALALEAIAETKGDSISFGFRRGRSAKDACEQIFCVLARKCSPTWILEGDIKGCFDNINH